MGRERTSKKGEQAGGFFSRIRNWFGGGATKTQPTSKPLDGPYGSPPSIRKPSPNVRGAAHVSSAADFEQIGQREHVVIGQLGPDTMDAKRLGKLIPPSVQHLCITPQAPSTPLTVDIDLLPQLETLDTSSNVRIVGSSERLRRLRLRQPAPGKQHDLGALPQLETLEYDAAKPMDAARTLNRFLSDGVLRSGTTLVVPPEIHSTAMEDRMAKKRVHLKVRGARRAKAPSTTES